MLSHNTDQARALNEMQECLHTQIPVAASLINKNEQEAFVENFCNHNFNSWHHRRQLAIWAALATDGSKILCTVLGEGVHFFFICFLKKIYLLLFIISLDLLIYILNSIGIGGYSLWTLYMYVSILIKHNIYRENGSLDPLKGKFSRDCREPKSHRKCATPMCTFFSTFKIS